jgi:hypothetical protein
MCVIQLHPAQPGMGVNPVDPVNITTRSLSEVGLSRNVHCCSLWIGYVCGLKKKKKPNEANLTRSVIPDPDPGSRRFCKQFFYKRSQFKHKLLFAKFLDDFQSQSGAQNEPNFHEHKRTYCPVNGDENTQKNCGSHCPVHRVRRWRL